MRSLVIRYAAAVLLLAAAVLPVQAQDKAQNWPDRPVKIIVPFGAGGSGDTLARVVAEHLSATFKQQFVVENRTGAGGAIGTAAIATAPPDGTTIGITNLSTLALVPAINPAASYHPLNDFTHIAYVAGAPVALAATPSSGIRTLKDFIATANRSAKETGKPLTFASSGVGSDGHLMGVAIALATGVSLEHVPYRSTSQALTDVVAGHVALCTFTLSSTAQFLRGGQLNGVAVTSPERMPDQPELPTFKELGYPQLVGTTWFSLSGPARLPAEIVEKINREVAAIVALPEVQARLRRDGFIAQPMSPADFTKYVGDEAARWKPLVETAGLAGKGG
jgi:tripartite-type tricarboxylate transporter receptor subunit TctC